MNTQERGIKKKHLVGFHADGKSAMLELCVFCKSLTDMDKIGECEHFAEKYVDGYNDGTGNKKSADVTPEEFMAYLNAAIPSDLMG